MSVRRAKLGNAMPFTDFIMVDWCASIVPVSGPNSVWIARKSIGTRETLLCNPSTRTAAMTRITDSLIRAVDDGRRFLLGFDFAFGYPDGAAERMTGKPRWSAVWRKLASEISEGHRNTNNRLEVAARLNAGFPGLGPFWGNGMKNDFPGLQRKKTGIVYGGNMPREFRQTEKHIREFGPAGARPHPVWQLNGNGSVGGQALTGIAALERLRRDPRLNGKIAVWPFETGFALPQSPVVLAEIYPSLVIPHPDEKVKDAGQVRALAEKLAGLEKKQTETLFATPPAYALDAKNMRMAVLREEGWILGSSGWGE